MRHPSSTDLTRLGASEAAARLARRELGAERYLEAHLERIAARDPEIRAFAALDPERARAAARALDRGPVRGLLHGLPLGIKDIFETYDLPTQGGSRVYAGFQGRVDAACVALARRAGAVIAGKTVTAELATFVPGPTRNPHDAAHTPGGSSSGSAAAVADFMLPLATGTQTLGSVVRPASFCGIVGFKPTYDLIPRKGVWASADSLDTVGGFGRSVRDVALLAAALSACAELLLPDESARAPRIGLCRTHDWERAEPAMQGALERSARALERAGARVRDVQLPDEFRGLGEAAALISEWEMSRTLADELERGGERLAPALRARCERAGELPFAEYRAAQSLAARCRAQRPALFADCDVLLAPAAVGEAPSGLESTGDPLFNRVWTLLHVPCVAVPAARGEHGLPLGLQVVGPAHADRATLAAADWVFGRL